MSVSVFGHTKNGSKVLAAQISSGNLSARVMEWGATLLDLRHAGVDRSLTLGFQDFATYETQGQHVGAIAGRFAGRIAGGFEIGEQKFETTRNNGHATLHGGVHGFGVSLWSLFDHGPDFIELVIRQPDGLDGFPGEIEARCRYEIAEGELRLSLSATANKPTICNLAQHSYFNLSGSPTIDDHVLCLAADRYTPLDKSLLPTGEVASCDEAREFRQARGIGTTKLDDHFVLTNDRQTEPSLAAILTGGGLEMAVKTTEPGLVAYTADKFPETSGGLSPHPYGPRSGLCLECQLWPDAPNHPGFPSAFLMPGQTYRQKTTYQLKVP